MIYQVVVIGLEGKKMLIDLCNTDEQFKSFTVKQLKEKILERLPGNIDKDDMELTFAAKPLEGDSTKLSAYGIQSRSTIQATMKLPGGLMA